MAQNAQEKIVSPKGIAVYPWLNRPDTKFSADGDFKVTLKVSADEAARLGADLTPLGAEKAGNADYVKMNKDSLKEWGAM